MTQAQANKIALYNCDLTIWQNYQAHLKSMPSGGSVIGVTDDGSIHNGMVILARCASKRDAVKLLADAGFQRKANGWKA